MIRTEQSRYKKRGVDLTEIILWTDRCGEQNSGRKNFRMCSETAAQLAVTLLLLFACPHHFAGVWDAWGGTEARLLKSVERDDFDTIRTAIDCVLTLRRLRKNLIQGNNELATASKTANTVVEESDEESDEEDSIVVESDVEASDVEEASGVEASDEEESTCRKKTFKVDSCHVHLLQQCPCRSEASCTCVPDERVKDTIFYRRDPRYEAKVIQGCASMFAYRFLPRRKYVVHIREYACETCPGCSATRAADVRYRRCVNLSTVKAVSYKGAGHKKALRSDLTVATGWVEHKIVPLRTSAVAGTRATDGLNRVDHRARLQYVGGLRVGDKVIMANISGGLTGVGDVKPRHFWVGQLLPPPANHTIVWKTRKPLPPDCPAGSYCCKIQWFQRTSRDGRFFTLASAQYISLACIVPVQYKIALEQRGTNRYEISEETQRKILITLGGLIIDD